jgi:putative glycosyltransferase (TIGR04372 family)
MLIKLEAFCRVIGGRFKEGGWGWFFPGLARRCGLELLWMLFLPVGFFGHLLGYRRLYVQTWHIGHLAADVDTFLKEQRLGFLPERRWFMTAPAKRVANGHLLACWRGLLPVVSDPFWAFILELISKRWVMRKDLTRYVSGYFGTQEIYRVNRIWGARPPILALSNEDEAWGTSELERLGLQKGQWFVCVHVREGSYIPKNETIQSHRNASITNTIPAIKEIVRRGGVCVRMGDPGMTPLPKITGVIDYAHHSMKSARLDIVLCAKARFFLGCTSGLSFVSAAFGIPIAHANMVPVETLGIRYCDLSIPKLLWSESSERYMRFDEIMDSKAGGYFFTHQYQKAGLRVEENSPEDILDLASEMLDRLEGRFVATSEDSKLHDAYLSLFRPGHYSYGADSRLCLGFLRRHRDLLNGSAR